MLNTYDEIEIFGLTEHNSILPIPSDDDLQQKIVNDAFDCLIGGLNGTGLQSQVEPLAHAFATVFYRRKMTIKKQLDAKILHLQALTKVEDGSEIFQTNVEDAQSEIEKINDILLAVEILFEQAAICYETETRNAFIPPSGGRSFKTSHLTGAIFEAKQWIEAHEAKKAKQFEIKGTPIAIAGEQKWEDVDTIFNTLDKVRSRFLNSKNTDIILYHKGDKIGVDKIVAKWAIIRKVSQVTFPLNWGAFPKSAGFKSIDLMFKTPRKLGGAVIFGSNGVALNLATKAEEKGLKVMHIKATKK